MNAEGTLTQESGGKVQVKVIPRSPSGKYKA